MPFQLRLALYTFLLSTLLVSTLLWILHSEHLRMRTVKIQQSQSLIFNMLEAPLRTALVTESYGELAHVLSSAHGNTHVENLTVLDHTEVVVAATRSELLGSYNLQQIITDAALSSAMPIEGASGHLGTLVVTLAEDPLVMRDRRARMILYCMTVISVVVMTLMSWFLGRAMNGKLKRLSDATASLAKGNWNIHLGHHDSNDEVGKLSNSFNEMVETLGRTRRQRQAAVMRLRRNNEQLATLVDEQKRTNAELKIEIDLRLRTESREKRVLEASPDATMIVHRDGTIEYVNRQVERLFSAERQTLLGSDLETLIPWSEILGIIETEHEALMLPPTLSTSSRSVFYATGEGNRRIPVEISASALSKDAPPVYIVVIRDISIQKKLESQTSQLQRDLIHMGRLASLSELATGLAHELNQPLTAITHNADAAILTIEGVAQPDLSQEQELRGYIQEIESQALRADGIIKTLRNFVRKQPSQLVELDLRETITRTIRLVERDAQDKEIDIRFDSWEPPPVFADPIEIAQVLLNLLTNAIDAIVTGDCPERWIAIKMGMSGDNLKICVEDSGPGLKNADHVFVPFVTTKKGGIGMGLHLCRNLVLSHGGDLWFESAAGGGARFLFTLPQLDQRHQEQTNAPENEAIPM